MNRGIVRYILFLVLMMGILPDLSFAQVTERDVKLSGDYFWGVGFSEDRQTAINNARRDLIEKMIVRIDSESSLTERDTNEDYNIELETTTNTMSRMELRGLNYLPAKEKRDGTWEAIAYVSKQEFANSMKIEEQRLLSQLEQALSDEAEQRLNSALPQYMDILASTFYYPVPFFTNAEQHGAEMDLRAFLSGKLNNWMNTLEVEIEDVRSLSTVMNQEYYFDLNVTSNNVNSSHLSFTLNKAGYASHIVRDGAVSIFYDLAPEEPVKEFVFRVNTVIPESIDREKVEILANRLPSKEIILPIDFSDVIDIDIEIEELGNNTFRFIPIIKDLNVFRLAWEFGNEETSSDTEPEYTFENSDDLLVSLIINDNDALSVSKTLKRNGILVEAEVENEPSDLNTVEEVEEVKITYSVPFRHQNYMNEIIRIKDGQRLVSYLNRLFSNNEVYRGRESDIQNTSASYIAIINPNNRQVIALLSPIVNNSRVNLLDDSNYLDQELSDIFKGSGTVWFQFR